MNWECLTSDELKQAIQTTQKTCLIPLSVLEKHGRHLPLGTDMFINRAISERAAQIEDVVVFPDFYLTQCVEAANAHGSIAVKADLCYTLLENVCDEIYRNGFNKIILANGHGGNSNFVNFFAQGMLNEQKPYALYVTDTWTLPEEDYNELVRIYGADVDPGHADMDETSLIMACKPELVHMERFNRQEIVRRERLTWPHENQVFAPICWYALYPEQATGEANKASAEYGRANLEKNAQYLARKILFVKKDMESLPLMEEFYHSMDNLHGHQNQQ